MADSHWVNAGS